MHKLLQQDPRRLGRPEGTPADDRLDPALAEGTQAPLLGDLQALVGAEHVLGRATDLVRYASDASPYRLVPKVVVVPETAEQVADVLRYCAEHGEHATFRAGGTSLSGQSQCDGILIDVRRHWGGMVVEQDGALLRTRPGVVLQHANAVLARTGRRLGPDPASAKACCIGGVLANNAAGMRCKIETSAYATTRAMTFVTPSGTLVNTENPDAEAIFAAAEPELAAGLLAIREEILADPELVSFLRQKYSIRNTTGLTMKAFLDAETPVEIYRRLMIGSEGLLGFIAEAVIETQPIPAVVGVCWVHLDSLTKAVSLVQSMTELGAEAVEMLNSSSLISASRRMTCPDGWADLPAGASSLLIEFGADTLDELQAVVAKVDALAAPLEPLLPVELSVDPSFIALSWKVRSEMNSDLAAMRPEGSININEDVCFPPSRLAEGVADLDRLLADNGFVTYVAGHAAYGNMHFTIAAMLRTEEGRRHYGEFMEKVTSLIVDEYGGSLKAEHGTGINMAPFVEREWGPKVTELMWRVKDLADPHGVLGRDVMLCRDRDVHLRRFKFDVLADPIIDACIECGFCEAVCPSRNVTTTPRQRIALRREMARQAKDSPLLDKLLEEYQYDAVETCAVDNSCADACPYGIDTGALMKKYRRMEASGLRNRVAAGVAKGWAPVETVARVAIGAADLVQQTVGTKPLEAVTGMVRKVVANDLMPAVPGPMPRAAGPLPWTDSGADPDQDGPTFPSSADAVYFPACVNRIFGRDPGVDRDAVSLPEALVAVSERAGRQLWIPSDVKGVCCGTIWSSKGYEDGRDLMYERAARSLLEWTREGQVPVVCDASSCTLGLLKELPKHLDADLARRYAAVRVIDSVDWAASLVDDLTIAKLPRITVHQGCSVRKLGLESTELRLAEAMADEVHVPVASVCCGTAGDRGLLHPELVVSATQDERRDLDGPGPFVSANRTCEMGLRQATGKPFESIILTLEEITRGV